MSYNNVISASDPQAVEKLTVKLQKCKELQITMKAVNAHWRKTGSCMGASGITDGQASKLDAKIANPRHSWENQPFSTYDLTNNNSEIKRLEKRIAEISHNREVGFVGWDFNGGKAVANSEMNRLQLLFDEKPSESQRTQLKSNGFKWAPSQDMGSPQNRVLWGEEEQQNERTFRRKAEISDMQLATTRQRQLNDNAIYAAGRLDFIKPLDGKRPSELQPKAPQHNSMNREAR